MSFEAQKPALLNIGCGTNYHTGWTNIDLFSNSPNVLVWDARKGLPFADGSFDACYSSHVLEHFTPDAARNLSTEMLRVLKPQGLARIVVPNLETIARLYLDKFEAACAGRASAEGDYDWMVLELYDQTVRAQGGGEMARYLASRSSKNSFIASRAGDELVNAVRKPAAPRSVWARVRSKPLSALFLTARLRLAEILVFIAAGKTGRSMFKEGVFRQSGEIHRWMYDRFSLGRLLSQAGFAGAAVCTADVSSIPNFNAYELDLHEGKVRKPDSLFMEARKE
jgi:SAM-dependent methyltransferase